MKRRLFTKIQAKNKICPIRNEPCNVGQCMWWEEVEKEISFFNELEAYSQANKDGIDTLTILKSAVDVGGSLPIRVIWILPARGCCGIIKN